MRALNNSNTKTSKITFFVVRRTDIKAKSARTAYLEGDCNTSV